MRKELSMKRMIAVILGIVLAYGLSWLATSVIVWLIFKCFDLQFSWKIATGIWLLLIILKSVFKKEQK